MLKFFAGLSKRNLIALGILFFLLSGFPLLVMGLTSESKGARAAALLPLGIVAVGGGAVLILFFSVAWHELGHYLAGKLVGLKLDAFQIGPFGWFRHGESFQLMRTGSLFQFSGFVAMSERDGTVTVRQLRTLIAGGPIASIILFAISLFAVIRFDALAALTSRDKPTGILSMLLLLFCYLAFILVYASAVPKRMRGIETDGLVLLKSYSDPEFLKIWFLILEVQPKVTAGLRARDWDGKALEELLSMPKLEGHRRLAVHYWSYYYHLDRGENEAALEHINEAFRTIQTERTFSIPARAGIANQCAFARASIAKDPVGAREAMEFSDKIPQSQKSNSLFAKAAIAAAEEDRIEALRLVDEALEAHRREHRAETPSSLAAREFWLKVRDQLASPSNPEVDILP